MVSILNNFRVILHDEDSPDVQLDVVLLLLVLEEVKWSTLWHEKKGTELELAFNGEVLNSQVLLPVIGQGLVELSVLLLGDVVRVSGPDGLGLIQFLIFSVALL